MAAWHAYSNPVEAVMDAKAKAILAEAVRRSTSDPAYFCRFFLSHWFPSEMPPFHLGMLAMITRKVRFLDDYPYAHEFLLNEFFYMEDPSDPTSRKIAVFELDGEGRFSMVAGEHDNIMVPRGFSKTTLTNAANLYEVVTDGSIFCVYISKSAEHADTQLGNIKFELETNERLRQAYGNQVPSRSDPEKWQADQLQLRNGAILIGRGKGGQVRGLNFRARRPNRIVMDDVEDDGTVESVTERKKTEGWFYTAVEKAGQQMEGAAGEEWAQQPLRIVNLGTLLGAECLMMTLAKDPKFNTVKFGAKLHLEDAESTTMLWPYKMSFDTYDRERKRHAKLGKLAEFSREIDSSIRVGDDAIFPSQFIYAPTRLSDLIHRSLALDPAISDRKKADHATMVVAGRRASDGAIWFLDEWGGTGKTPRDKIDQFFAFHERYQTTHNGIEAVAYQASLIFLMQEEMARRKYYFPITAIKQRTDQAKEARITGLLSPRYKIGVIRHLKPLPNLEGNLHDWPNGKKDYADAAAMCLTLLGESQQLAMGSVSGPPTEDDWQSYAPAMPALPPVYNLVGNYIMEGSSPLTSGRYGTRG